MHARACNRISAVLDEGQRQQRRSAQTEEQAHCRDANPRGQHAAAWAIDHSGAKNHRFKAKPLLIARQQMFLSGLRVSVGSLFYPDRLDGRCLVEDCTTRQMLGPVHRERADQHDAANAASRRPPRAGCASRRRCWRTCPLPPPACPLRHARRSRHHRRARRARCDQAGRQPPIRRANQDGPDATFHRGPRAANASRAVADRPILQTRGCGRFRDPGNPPTR